MANNELISHTASLRSERRLAAIMFTDIVGFSRQMGAAEVHAE